MAYYAEGDSPIVTTGSNVGGYGNGMWGDGAWWIIILLIFGWGNNGWGGNNGLNGALTRSDLCQDMNFNNLEASVRGVQNGLCDGFYAVNTSLLTGFGNVNNAITQSGWETRSAISDLSYRMQDCCCQTQRAIDGVNYNLASSTCSLQNTMNNNTRDIIAATTNGTQRILDYLCNEKICALQAENSLLTSQLSQNSQTATLLQAINKTPSPAYVVPNPYASYYTGFGCNYNNCGCGCSGASVM